MPDKSLSGTCFWSGIVSIYVDTSSLFEIKLTDQLQNFFQKCRRVYLLFLMIATV